MYNDAEQEKKYNGHIKSLFKHLTFNKPTFMCVCKL